MQTPDNLGYLVLGLTLFFGIAAFYILTLVYRFGKARRDLIKVERYIND